MEARWEYKVIKFKAKGWFLGGKVDADELESALNRLGNEGWDLISIFDTNEGYGNTKDVVATLKRKI